LALAVRQARRFVFQSAAQSGERVIALVLVVMIGHVNIKHACYVADHFQDVNIPIEPAV
jgi:hypothetical protein